MLNKDKQKRRRIFVNIVLCDDNEVFLDYFQNLLVDAAAKADWGCQYSRYQSPQKLLAQDLSSVDVVFLDIDMPELNGIEAGKALRERYPDLMIVFVTGFVQYARDGYSVEAFRYLLKDSLNEELPMCLRDIYRKLHAIQAWTDIKYLDYTAQVRLRDILYFEGTAQRHTVLHTSSGESVCLGKLNKYEADLQGKGFLRIQRSYLVNMAHILYLKNYYVFLSNGEQLKASERNYPAITSAYLAWKGKQL